MIIALANTDKAALVDNEDYPILSRYKWHLDAKGYAVTSLLGSTLRMHRFILNPSKNDQVDHINRNKLDNQKDNLRLCCNTLNQANTVKRECINGRKTSSKYKGVHFRKDLGRWSARISHQGVKYDLGQYGTEEEAAVVYNAKAKEFWGSFAVLNDVENEETIIPKPFCPGTPSSPYRGVSRFKDKWIAQIKVKQKKYHLGVFVSEVEAARAYNEKAKELHGTKAKLNEVFG